MKGKWSDTIEDIISNTTCCLQVIPKEDFRNVSTSSTVLELVYVWWNRYLIIHRMFWLSLVNTFIQREKTNLCVLITRANWNSKILQLS
jgi:hypothetical protein